MDYLVVEEAVEVVEEAVVKNKRVHRRLKVVVHNNRLKVYSLKRAAI